MSVSRSPSRPIQVFVGGLSVHVTVSELQDYLSTFAPIYICEIIKDNRGNSKGYGFAEFANIDQARKTLGKFHVLQGKVFEVRLYVDPNQNLNLLKKLAKRKVFLSGLKNLSESDLSGYFSQYGRVEELTLNRDHGTQTLRGFGFVIFSKVEEANLVIQAHVESPHIVNGIQIKVAQATIKQEMYKKKGEGKGTQAAKKATKTQKLGESDSTSKDAPKAVQKASGKSQNKPAEIPEQADLKALSQENAIEDILKPAKRTKRAQEGTAQPDLSFSDHLIEDVPNWKVLQTRKEEKPVKKSKRQGLASYKSGHISELRCEGVQHEQIRQEELFSNLQRLEEHIVNPDFPFGQVRNKGLAGSDFETRKANHRGESRLGHPHDYLSNPVTALHDTENPSKLKTNRLKCDIQNQTRCLEGGSVKPAISQTLSKGALTSGELQTILAVDPNLRLNIRFKPQRAYWAGSAHWYSSSPAGGTVVGSQRCH